MENWISVREKMPPDTTSVLVWCPDRRNKYTACWVAPDWIHFGGSFGKIVSEDVTYWMPTPSPPAPPLTTEEAIVESIISTVQKVGKFPRWGEDLRPFAKTVAREITFDLWGSE